MDSTDITLLVFPKTRSMKLSTIMFTLVNKRRGGGLWFI